MRGYLTFSGLNGITKLKLLDEQFDEYEPELFHLSRLHFQRGMQLREEEDELNMSLERMITRLSPYFHLNACMQVLEWLIYKYQVGLSHTTRAFLSLLTDCTCSDPSLQCGIRRCCIPPLPFHQLLWASAEHIALQEGRVGVQ